MGYNKEWVKSVDLETFLKVHAHLGSKEQLTDEYNKIVPPKKKEKVKEGE